jgi:hypothetical protein
MSTLEIVSSDPVHAVIDAEGKIAAWYIVQPDNVQRIPIPDEHTLVMIERRPHMNETHVDLATGELMPAGSDQEGVT